MLRSVLTAALGAATALGASGWTRVPDVPAAKSAAMEMSFQGHIVLVAKNQLVVSVAGGHIRFLVADDTRIGLNGIPVTLKVLQPRYAVSILAEIKGQRVSAKHIEAAMCL